jgi:hypothetical protein
LKGATWVPEEKVWTATDCRRNWMQLESLQEDPKKTAEAGYVVLQTPREFERYWNKLIHVEPRRPEVRAHQRVMIDFAVTKHCVELAAEQGTGKTLAAIELMEWAAEHGFSDWWYVAPLKVTKAIELELEKWKCKVKPRLIHYDILYAAVEARFGCIACCFETNETRTWAKRRDKDVVYEDENGYHDCGTSSNRFPRCPECKSETELHESLWRRLPDVPAPHGVIYDESSFLKNGGSRRGEAAQHLADAIREEHDGFVINMSGTPAPRDPSDWHSQIEIICPGWFRESSKAHLVRRLAIIEKGVTEDGREFPHVLGWKQDEVARLYERMKPIVTIHFAKDCLELPELTKEVVTLSVAPDVYRAAQLIAQSSTNAVQALNRLRQLSDGFQYGGVVACSDCHGDGQLHIDAELDTIECHACNGIGLVETGQAQRSDCPKDECLRLDLGINETTGRIVIYGGYHASIDRIIDVCRDEGWAVVRCDGRGWGLYDCPEGWTETDTLREMDASTRSEFERLAFVAHPGSGGFGLNLTAAVTNVFYSNDFNAASRWQAEKRSHRMGQTRGVRIKDYVHLPTDQFVLENLEKKRALQAVTLGEVLKYLE